MRNSPTRFTALHISLHESARSRYTIPVKRYPQADKAYKYLFSHPEMVEQLLEGFVDEAWVKDLDFSGLVNVEKSFITDDFKGRESDVIWKLPFKGRDLYLYLLIEFQSAPDRFMALRVLNYLCLFYLDYLKERKSKGGLPATLPPVFPIVLYNGDRPWNCPDNINELIEEHPFLRAYYPNFRYRPIIERDYSIKELLGIRNTVAALFALENSRKEDYEGIIGSLADSIGGEDAETIGLLALWLRHLLRNERVPAGLYAEAMNIRNEKEAKSMLVTEIASWREELIEQGIEKGIEQGIEKGIEKGERRAKLESAKALKARGIDIALIAEATGLTLDEVRDL